MDIMFLGVLWLCPLIPSRVPLLKASAHVERFMRAGRCFGSSGPAAMGARSMSSGWFIVVFVFFVFCFLL